MRFDENICDILHICIPITLIAWTKPSNGFPKYENVKDRNHAYKLTELWAKLKTFKNLQKPSRDCTHKVYVYLSYFTWTQFFIESDPTIWGKNDLTIATILWNSRDHLGLKWIWPRLFQLILKIDIKIDGVIIVYFSLNRQPLSYIVYLDYTYYILYIYTIILITYFSNFWRFH